jgi:hypothetical protein
MAKKKSDPKAKAKRQKVFLAVGGVFLLALLAFQVPRTMKMMKAQSESSSSSTPAATTTAAGSTPLAPPSLDGSSAAGNGTPSAASSATSTSTTADGVSDPSDPLPPNAGQLVSFSKFKSKDPFHQQINDCGTLSTGTAATDCASGSAPTSATPKTSTTPASGGGSPTLIGPAAKPTSGMATKAVISVNGLAGMVGVGRSFPAGTPVFTLVSLTRSAAKIGIAGGSYENGAATVTLKKGKPVTLLNTASGKRYLLQLVSTA